MMVSSGRGSGVNTFRLVSSLAVLPILAALGANPGWGAGGDKDVLAYYDRFQKIEGLFDASGAAQLPDGRVVVVLDDKTAPLAMLRLQNGRFTPEIWPAGSLADRSGGHITSLTDLEDVAVSPTGVVYALGSQGGDAQGLARGRENFARFRVDGERMVEASVITSLKPALIAAHPAFAEAAKNPDNDTGLNIEGLAFNPDKTRLLLGFRAPLVDNKAVIATIANPEGIFGEKAVPRIVDLAFLDLDGGGIRSMAWLPKLQGYLISSRMDSPAGKGPFRLWFWSGEKTAKPRAVSIADMKSPRRPEGIAPVTIGGDERILLVSDEGDTEGGRSSQVALISYDRLRIAP